jgi:hypothetical protein
MPRYYFHLPQREGIGILPARLQLLHGTSDRTDSVRGSVADARATASCARGAVILAVTGAAASQFLGSPLGRSA